MEKFGLLALGGRGGGGGLPPVTSADNGKVLAVEDGAWAAADSAFVCTFTKSGNTISCDKARAEIVAAYEAKQTIIGYADFGWAGQSGVSGKAVMLMTEVTLNNGAPTLFTFSCPYHLDGDSVSPDTDGTFFLKGLTFGNFLSWNVKYVPRPREPLVVTYTITGLPVDGEYPLSVSKSYDYIFAALQEGRTVTGMADVGTTGLMPPLTAVDTTGGYIMYSTIVYYANNWCVAKIIHNLNDSATAQLIPIQTIPT